MGGVCYASGSCYIVLPTKKRAYFCKIAIEIGGAWPGRRFPTRASHAQSGPLFGLPLGELGHVQDLTQGGTVPSFFLHLRTLLPGSRNVLAMLFKSIGVRGPFDSPDFCSDDPPGIVDCNRRSQGIGISRCDKVMK